jgi:hypothetical protein
MKKPAIAGYFQVPGRGILVLTGPVQVSHRARKLRAICSTSSSPLARAEHTARSGHKQKWLPYGSTFLSLCPGEDLNLHALRHIHLKDACIPISSPGHEPSHTNRFLFSVNGEPPLSGRFFLKIIPELQLLLRELQLPVPRLLPE